MFSLIQVAENSWFKTGLLFVFDEVSPLIRNEEASWMESLFEKMNISSGFSILCKAKIYLIPLRGQMTLIGCPMLNCQQIKPKVGLTENPVKNMMNIIYVAPFEEL